VPYSRPAYLGVQHLLPLLCRHCIIELGDVLQDVMSAHVEEVIPAQPRLVGIHVLPLGFLLLESKLNVSCFGCHSLPDSFPKDVRHQPARHSQASWSQTMTKHDTRMAKHDKPTD
jgi:hypothetical protein